MNKKIEIVIVGAGLAGLACAYELSKNKNCKIRIVEAKGVIGGRVRTFEINKQMVDFGGFIIYQWYKCFNKLVHELDIFEKLSPIPLNKILYDIHGDSEYLEEEALDLPLKETIKMGLKSLPKTITDLDVVNPNLEDFEGKSILEYLRSLSTSAKDSKLYEDFFDTVCQGYCYGGIDKYKAAFALPIVREVILHGDIKSAYFFRNGNDLIINNLVKKIKKNGGKIFVNTNIVKIDEGGVYSNRKKFQADTFVFAQTMFIDLYKQIIPDLDFDFEYTHFVTATLNFSHTPIINGSADWGAIFFAPNKNLEIQILSAVNLRTLYSDKLCGYVNVNIVIRSKFKKPINKKSLLDSLQSQIQKIFTDFKCKGITKMINWEKTMPIANENFVNKIRTSQGTNNYYFAGDYLGCPSMETAVATGINIAKQILIDQNARLMI